MRLRSESCEEAFLSSPPKMSPVVRFDFWSLLIEIEMKKQSLSQPKGCRVAVSGRYSPSLIITLAVFDSLTLFCASNRRRARSTRPPRCPPVAHQVSVRVWGQSGQYNNTSSSSSSSRIQHASPQHGRRGPKSASYTYSKAAPVFRSFSAVYYNGRRINAGCDKRGLVVILSAVCLFPADMPRKPWERTNTMNGSKSPVIGR